MASFWKAATLRSLLWGACASVALAAPAHAQEQQRIQFNIPAQATSSALNEFSRQAGVQILFPYDLAARTNVSTVEGSFTRQEALNRLLQGSTLRLASDDGRTVVLQDPSSPTQLGAAEPGVEEEIVVTGTHIRGVSPAAPVHTVTRTDINRSGHGQIGDIIRSLPETFSGGQNPGVMAASTAHQNITNGSTVNLRGLGADATLVLLNGRRLAADGYGQAPDISSIPLAALQRVEIVTDGSSAIYGSDAVAGVTNFILRRDFDGVEVSARVGGATQGSAFEQSYSLLAGASGRTGFALLGLDYTAQDGIRASDRDFTSGVVPRAHILQPYERVSALLSAGYDVSDRISISLDALWSDRGGTSLYAPSLVGQQYEIATDVETYSVAGNLDIGLSDSWNLRLTAGTANSEAEQEQRFTGGLSAVIYQNEVHYGELAIDGPLLRLPTGDLQIALGGGARDEKYTRLLGGAINPSGSRTVHYMFGEAFVPLVSPSSERAGLNSLDLSLSARLEDYGDFGSASTPKIGVRYIPTAGITLRGTWGESFKAPAFNQMISARNVLVYPAATFGHAGGGTALYASGGTPDLRPERSTSWTIGAEYSPQNLASMTLGATYFNIDYEDRVVLPVSSINTGLSNPAFAPFVISNPTPQQQADLIASAQNFSNFSGAPYDPSDIVAIVSNRYANATSQTVEGVDLAYRQAFSLPAGSLDLFVNITWIDIRQQTLPSLPETAMSGTVNNIPEFRARAGLSWGMGGFTLTGIGNYMSGSVYPGTSPQQNIDSWTTFDATLSYAFPSSESPLSGLNVAFSIANLFDLDPPLGASQTGAYEGIYFDTTNTSPIGRFVALTLRKHF